MSKDKSADVLDQAMRDALASVERIEHANKDNGAVGVEVETGASPAADAALKAENEQLRDQLLRLAADFDNFRKRVRKEQEDMRRFGATSLAQDVLPIVDNLDRALSHSEGHDDPVIVGVRMVAKQFHDILSSHGIKTFASENQVFDPERHEAVGREESADHQPGVVLREMQRGYMIHDRLLRPARVMVSAAPGEGKTKGSMLS